MAAPVPSSPTLEAVRGAFATLATTASEHAAGRTDPAIDAMLRTAVAATAEYEKQVIAADELRRTKAVHARIAALYVETRRNARAHDQGKEPLLTAAQQLPAFRAALKAEGLSATNGELQKLILKPEVITGIKDGPKQAADRTLSRVLPTLFAREQAKFAALRQGNFGVTYQALLPIRAPMVGSSTIRNRRKAAQALPPTVRELPRCREQGIVTYGLQVLLGPLSEERPIQEALHEIYPSVHPPMKRREWPVETEDYEVSIREWAGDRAAHEVPTPRPRSRLLRRRRAGAGARA